ncbi:16S rRNA (guanine(966)-N(2))-methyltransferase RsmD [Ningiella sp. W23]|uniref:16S rRNA (guanine(966)-N(2))-methyltransferase RsmD n=1 Tax=Ningiella sp. W23 TaxID=3023715 RepID=UPI0037573A39
MPSSKPRHSSSKGNIRIIAGTYRGRKLPVLDMNGLRPTADRVKETLFNWLMHDLPHAKVLDMFSGAGSLGFEALSRGAASVTLIEKAKASYQQLQKNAQILKAEDRLEVIHADALQACSMLRHAYDIVFIDPPFNQQLVNPALDALVKYQCLKDGGLVYIETEADFDDSKLHHFGKLSMLKEKSSQTLRFRLFKYYA